MERSRLEWTADLEGGVLRMIDGDLHAIADPMDY